ncbi:unnamed protein product [Hydatigera taeniaeformis]|uniref:TMEM131_like domain-containing protein n=1 Tax=Hydatigena taeniaeformis TaxID=6205 RepID=A0A0R3WJX2_HYDTA|nr:unnamed protein product [Hydatigera taeniaeformis]
MGSLRQVSRLSLSTSNYSRTNGHRVAFSSVESSCHLEQASSVHQAQNSITLAGQESGLCSLTLSSTVPKTLNAFVTGVILLVNASASDPEVPQNSSSNFLLREFFLKPTVFLFPLELHFDTPPNLFYVQEEVLDFGNLMHSDPPRRLHLTAFNQMAVPSALFISTKGAGNYLEISYDPVVFPDDSNHGKEIATIMFNPAVVDRFGEFSGNVDVVTDGQSPIVIPYVASVLQGSLQFSHQDLSFYCGHPGGVFEKERTLTKKIISLTNTFKYPLEIWGYRLPEAYADLFEIDGLVMVEFLPPMASVNISIKFRGPRQQEAFVCKVDSFKLIFYTNASSFHVSLNIYDAKLKILSPYAEISDDALTFDVFDLSSQYTPSFYVSNPNPIAVVIRRLRVVKPDGSQCVNLGQIEQRSGLFCHHHHRSSEAEVILVSERNCTSASAKPLSLDLQVHNSLAKPLQVTSVELCSNHDTPKLQFDPFHPIGVTSINLEPNRTTVIGSLSYNASLDCREVLAASITSGFGNDNTSSRVCYAGFEIGSAKGRYWLATNFFPLNDDGLPNHRVISTQLSGIAFFPGLQFSANLFTQMQNAWRSLTRSIHMTTVGTAPLITKSTEECQVIECVAIRATGKEKPSFVGHLVANLVWPRILSEHVKSEMPSVRFTPSSICQLNLKFGSTEGLAQLRIQNLVTEIVTCRLTLINPTERPLIIQPILLDDLLPVNMNYTKMVEEMPLLSEELFRAAHVPQHLTKFPQVSYITPQIASKGRISYNIPLKAFEVGSVATLLA